MADRPIPARSEVPEESTWNLKDVFESNEAWQAEYEAFKAVPEQIEAFRGRLGESVKVLVCDERGELGACYGSVPQNDLGSNCDLLTAYPKAEGIMIALRSFSPDIIICDEVASEEEAAAIEIGLNSGVCFALSLHAGSVKELRRKPIARRLAQTGAFDTAVLLSGRESKNIKVSDLFD